MDNFYKNIGKTISNFRKQQKKSQEKFAEEYLVSVRQVQRWEAGECIPEPLILRDFCKAGMNMNELFKGIDTNSQLSSKEKTNDSLSDLLTIKKLYNEQKEKKENEFKINEIYVMKTINYLKPFIERKVNAYLSDLHYGNNAICSNECMQECYIAILEHIKEFDPNAISITTFFLPYVNIALKSFVISLKPAI